MKIAICQIRTEIDQAETVAKAARMVREAAANGADIVVLPEMWNCPYSKEYFKKYANLGHESTVAEMKRWAKELNILLVGGSIPETEDGKIYNTCFVFDKNGEQIARHRKVHLFDVDMPTMRFRESSTFTGGSDVTVFDTEWGKMGAAVCFDVRFPEIFRAMAVRGARMVFLPAQFSTTTGPKHWDLAIRSRAVDNQYFLVAASAARYEGFNYECWGHSSVVDPYGYIVQTCDEKEQIVYCDVDLDMIETVRAQLPIMSSIRRDVYTVTE